MVGLGLISFPPAAGALGAVCPYGAAIRNNQRMNLVKYFHNSFLLIFFLKKLFPKHFQIKKIIKLMLQVLVSLICTLVPRPLSVRQGLLDSSVAVKCDIHKTKDSNDFFLKYDFAL